MVAEGFLEAPIKSESFGEDSDCNTLTTLYSNGVGGGSSKVDYPFIGAPVVDLHYHLEAGVGIGDQHQCPEFDFPVSGRVAGMLEDFSGRGLVADKSVGVDSAVGGVGVQRVIGGIVLPASCEWQGDE